MEVKKNSVKIYVNFNIFLYFQGIKSPNKMTAKILEEIKEVLVAKIEIDIEDCLKELAKYQREHEWRYLRPHVHIYNQKYLSYQRTRQTRYWSYRQKRIQHEFLKQDLKLFIHNIVDFESLDDNGGKIKIIYLNGDHNVVMQDIKNTNASILK